MSLNRENDNTKTHFFANINKKQKNKNYEINLQKVSNDNYLKKYNIKSPLIKTEETPILNSYIKFNISEKYYNFESSIEVFENLEEETSDRFEFIYPNYNFEKYLLEFLDL